MLNHFMDSSRITRDLDRWSAKPTR